MSLELHIPRFPAYTFSKCCMTCKYLSYPSRSGGICHKYDINVLSEHYCEGFEEEVSKQSKIGNTLCYKQNVSKITKQYLVDNKVVVPLKFKEVLKATKNNKNNIKNIFSDNEEIYFACVELETSPRKIIATIASRIPLNYDEFEFILASNENLMRYKDATNILLYIYEKYK